MDNTREKLIKVKRTLEMCYKQGITSECNGCAYRGHNNVCMDALMEDALAVINHLESNVSVQEWISVKDRLPENDYGKHWKERKYYLVRYEPSGLMCVAHYGYKEYDWWIDGHYCVLSATNFKEVTHWMEISNLPQPPKGE